MVVTGCDDHLQPLSDGKMLLEALSESLKGRRQMVGHELWPTMSVASAAAKVGKVCDGDLGIPAALLDSVIRNPGHEPLTEYIDRASQPDPAVVDAQILRCLGVLEQVFSELAPLIKARARSQAASPSREMAVVRPSKERRAAG